MRYTVNKMQTQRGGQGPNRQRQLAQAGFTLVELSVTMVIIAIVVVSFFGLFISLVHSTIVAKRRNTALVLATNQMESLKSLPYDSLIVQSPTTVIKTVNGVKYTVSTVVRYADDAYDGCGSYPTQAQKQQYCRNYPPPSGAPALDTNPNDYKVVRVSVADNTSASLASVDTQIAARVAETNSTTGALFVTILDDSGSPISGATVGVSNTTLAPNISKSDTSDSHGVVIFYGLPPDSGADYVITASKANYSSLGTISSSGSLQATYGNQKILTQASSSVTLVIAPQGSNSLVVETTDTSGAPISNVSTYVKGGYKQYTNTSDYSYYYDNFYSNYNSHTVSDNRILTNSSGLATISNLPPINKYLFCNSDNTSVAVTNCNAGGTKYYLAAAVPYGGSNPLSPIIVPTYSASNPPGTTYDDGAGNAFLQKVRLMLTTSSNFPRVYSMNPYSVSLGSGGSLSSFQITYTGYNLTNANAILTQSGNTYSPLSSCTSTATQLQCTYDLSSIVSGSAQVAVSNGSGTLTLPITPLGGFSATP